MQGKLWFGNATHQQWVPAPKTGAGRKRTRYSESIEFENGGMNIVSSNQWRNSFDFNFPVQDSSQYEGLEAFTRFASGEYGDDYIRFADPMIMDQNVLPPSYATPSLMFNGWYNWLPGVVVEPLIGTAGVSITIPANQPAETPIGVPFRFMVPPGHKVCARWVGDVDVLGWFMISDSSGIQAVVGPDGDWHETSSIVNGGLLQIAPGIGIADDVGTFEVESLEVVVLPAGHATPSNTNRVVPGKGNWGLRFSGTDVIPETYVMAGRHLTGMSFNLAETEPWDAA